MEQLSVVYVYYVIIIKGLLLDVKQKYNGDEAISFTGFDIFIST